MNDHWAKFLPDFGENHLVERITSLQVKAEEHRRMADLLEKEAKDIDVKLKAVLSKHWTESQMRDARLDAEAYGTVEERRESVQYSPLQ